MEKSSSSKSVLTDKNKEPTGLSDVQTKGVPAMFDGILRNQEYYFEDIFAGKNLTYYLKWFCIAIVCLTAIYGWSMQALWYGLTAMCEKSDLYPKQAIQILQVWILVFGFVGTQMAWSLRPFVGSPDRQYQFIRTTQDGNFYQMVWSSIRDLGKKID